MKFYKTSERTIIVESYVTLRSEWSSRIMVSMDYNARGHRVKDGEMEWQYFTDEIEAKKWCESIHQNEE